MSDPQNGDGAETPGASDPRTPDADSVIDAFGGIRPMANRLDVAVSTVQGWKVRNHIPENRWSDVIAAADAAGVDLAKLAPGDAARETAAPAPEPASAKAPETKRSETKAPDAKNSDAKKAEAKKTDAGTDGAKGTTTKAAPSRTPAAGSKTPRRPARKPAGGPAWLALVAGVVAIVGVATEPYWRDRADAVLDPVMRQAFPGAVKSAGDAPAPTPTVDPARIEALAGDIADLSARIDGLAGDIADSDGAGIGPQAVEDLRARIAALEESAGRPAPVSGSGDMPAETGGSAADLDALRGRIETLETALDGLAEADQLASLRDRAAALEQRVTDQADRLEELADAPALKGAQEAALVIAVGSVQDAIAAGRPFAEPLSRVKALAAGDAAVADAVVKLTPLAADGVISRDQLLRRFIAAAPDMHSGPAADAGLVEETLGRLATLVSLRQTGEGADRPPVSRAEAALGRGDLVGAVAALSELAGESAAVDNWLAAAEARLAAESALDALRSAATERLTGATEG